MKQSKFDSLCQAERGWAFERVVGGLLEGFNHKEVNSWTLGSVMYHVLCSVLCHVSYVMCHAVSCVMYHVSCIMCHVSCRVPCVMFQVNNIETRAECARLCLLEEEFPCRWAESHFFNH